MCIIWVTKYIPFIYILHDLNLPISTYTQNLQFLEIAKKNFILKKSIDLASLLKKKTHTKHTHKKTPTQKPNNLPTQPTFSEQSSNFISFAF